MHADQLTITSPCPVELDEDLSNGEKRFFCDHCDKNVHVLSNMTEREATRFLASRKGQDTCVTYLHDKDGNVRYKREPDIVPLSRLRLPKKRSMVRRAAAAALALAACTPYADSTEQQVDPIVEHAAVGEIQAIPEIEEVPVAGKIAIDEPIEPVERVEPVEPVEAIPPVVEPTVDEPVFMPVAGGMRPDFEEPIGLEELPCDKPLAPQGDPEVAEEEEPCDAPPVVDTPAVKTHKPGIKRGKIKRPKKQDLMIRGGI